MPQLSVYCIADCHPFISVTLVPFKQSGLQLLDVADAVNLSEICSVNSNSASQRMRPNIITGQQSSKQ